MAAVPQALSNTISLVAELTVTDSVPVAPANVPERVGLVDSGERRRARHNIAGGRHSHHDVEGPRGRVGEAPDFSARFDAPLSCRPADEGERDSIVGDRADILGCSCHPDEHQAIGPGAGRVGKGQRAGVG